MINHRMNHRFQKIQLTRNWSKRYYKALQFALANSGGALVNHVSTTSEEPPTTLAKPPPVSGTMTQRFFKGLASALANGGGCMSNDIPTTTGNTDARHVHGGD